MVTKITGSNMRSENVTINMPEVTIQFASGGWYAVVENSHTRVFSPTYSRPHAVLGWLCRNAFISMRTHDTLQKELG